MASLRRAFVTGIGGQDGTYLARWLLDRGVEVYGIARRPPGAPELEGARVHVGDAADASVVAELVAACRPDACFHLAAHHRPSEARQDSFEHDREVLRVNVASAHAVLEAARRHAPSAGVVLAGSCQMFGVPLHAPQSEATVMAPRNPYAIAKVAAYHLAGTYRDTLGLRASTAILYQHESPLRGTGFLSQRIARGVAAIARGEATVLELGNLDAVVDWTWVEDVCDALVRMASADTARDYVVARGQPCTVREIVKLAFARVGMEWEPHVRVNPELIRPAPVVPYVGDATRIRNDLGWSARTDEGEIVRRLVDAALAARARA